jgi:glycosyltransferase involved in cell wall biosynthesis
LAEQLGEHPHRQQEARASVGGIPEVVAAPEAGRLVDEATPQALSTAIRELLADPPSRDATRA